MPPGKAKEAPTTSSVSDDEPSKESSSDSSLRFNNCSSEELEELDRSFFDLSTVLSLISTPIESIKAMGVAQQETSHVSIPRDDPTMVFAELKDIPFKTIKVETVRNEGEDLKQTRILIESKQYFPKLSSTIGAYISIYGSEIAPSLIFIFTSSGMITTKKYEFPEYETCFWQYIPLDLPDIDSFKMIIEDPKHKDIGISSLAFVREETPEESTIRKSRDVALEKLWHESTSVKAEFMNEANDYSLPIPRDDPTIIDPAFETVKAVNLVYSTEMKAKGVHNEGYDQSLRAQDMLKGERHVFLSHLSIPFPAPSFLKGAYICISKRGSSPFLLFTFTDCDGMKISKKYEFTNPKFWHEWHFLPIDLDNVILCEIEGKGQWEGKKSRIFVIESLAFIREETLEESLVREAREILWSEALIVNSEFVKEGDRKSKGRDSIPIPRDDPRIILPSFSLVKGKRDVYSKESKEYDVSLKVQKMLKGEDYVWLSHLSIPFPSPSPIKGAYICVEENTSSPLLLFTFTLSDGTKISKKYEFTEPKHEYEWHFLPIDLEDVVLCEIDGNGTLRERKCRDFFIYSLVFLLTDEFIATKRLCQLPWEQTGDDNQEKR
ncbi:hypothetical protein ADUPG1_012716 [Aduncisulcus paluster]|uniref:NudC domain-containing protein 1 n=1 Tax=Aduncisulcus paluster TaxID=2918883 RepID=A0ABQ5K3M8_9EUKA|nr:hypothetical protein ADUPG1_012716 [Aduncisulcus paluster]